jgi:outer membrane lipoprotein-sorting protein
LPSLPGLTGGGGDANLTNLIAGSNTARVWYAGEDKVRLALIGTLGETDVIRNGTDAWIWQSSSNTATHTTLPAGVADKKPSSLATDMATTPQAAAAAALAAIDPTTSVTTTGSAKVAGRDAYELVLAPKDTASLIGQVRLAIDAKQHIPLRVDVYAKGANNPAVRVAFQQISFTVPDAQQFTFNPPPGAKVNTEKPGNAAKEHADATPGKPGLVKPAPGKPGLVKPGAVPAKSGDPTVIGKGWTSVLVAKLPTEADATKGKDSQQFAGIVNSLPKVSGSWGSGHLLKSALFSALITDDGRVLAGAVAPETLYAAAGK